MRPEFKVKNDYNKKQAAIDILKEISPGEANDKDYIDKIIGIIETKDNDLNETELFIKDLWNSRKETYNTPTISKVKFDWNKPVWEQSKQAMNNAILDIMKGVLTNKDTTNKILNPGGFDDQKMAARIVTLAQSDIKTLLDTLGVKDAKEAFDKLNKMSLKQLDKLTESLRKPFDPLSPVTLIAFHRLNMAGGASIGMFANHNVHHAVLQSANLQIIDKDRFTLNGKNLFNLSRIKNDEGQYISKNNAGYLAASVDNVKDPVLGFMNLNTFTNDTGMLLSRLGFQPKEVGLFLGQPILVELSELYFKESQNGKSYLEVVKMIKDKYAQVSNNGYNVKKELAVTSLDQLFNNIVFGASIGKFDVGSERLAKYNTDQLAILEMFKHVYDIANELKDYVGSMRADTAGGAAGPSIAHTLNKVQKAYDTFSKENSHFSGTNLLTVDMNIEGKTKEEVFDMIMRSPIPFALASYTFGLESTESYMSKYFPEYSAIFRNAVILIGANTKRGKLNVQETENVYNALYQYLLSDLPFFGDEMVDGELLSLSDKRKLIIQGLPVRINRMKNSGKYNDIELIRRLNVFKDKELGFNVVKLMNSGGMSLIVKDRLMSDWTNLLYMDDKDANRLALDLFRYSYYLDGFNFGPNSFMNLAPVAVLEAIPGYLDAVRSMVDNVLFDEDIVKVFLKLFLANNLDNPKYTPIQSASEVSFFKRVVENGLFVDEFVLTDLDGDTAGDMKIKLTEIKDGEGIIYIPFTQFALTNEKEKAYYVLGLNNTYYKVDNKVSRNGVQYYDVNAEVANELSLKESDYLDSEFDYEVNYDTNTGNREMADVGFLAMELSAFNLVYGDQQDMFSFYNNENATDSNNEKIC